MTKIANAKLLITVVAAGAMQLSSMSATAAEDAVAAQKLARVDRCLRCHAVGKKKEGPSYQSIAYKYKGNAEAADILYKHLTSNEMVKLSDGHSENHKVAKAKTDDEVKNLITWILMQ